MYNIVHRRKILINTDPQRRCYNGCHFSSELIWSQWAVLEHDVPPDKLASRLRYWRELNDYAISQRGEEARQEFDYVLNYMPAVQNPAH